MKKILLILLALFMFMVSCGGPSKEEPTKKPIGEEKREEETSIEKVDVFNCIDYAVSVDEEFIVFLIKSTRLKNQRSWVRLFTLT